MNAKTFVEGQQSVFDALWNKALPAEQRFREIEEGLKPDFIETISNPSEIQKLTFDLVKSAKEEITILFSTVNAFKRQEHVGLMWLLQETDPTVKVKILIPTAFTLENTLKNEFDENRRIEIRDFSRNSRLDSSLQTILTSLTADRKLRFVVELRDDTKANSYKEVGLATYSNSESFVWTHASIFETLWIKSELYSTMVFIKNKPPPSYKKTGVKLTCFTKSNNYHCLSTRHAVITIMRLVLYKKVTPGILCCFCFRTGPADPEPRG